MFSRYKKSVKTAWDENEQGASQEADTATRQSREAFAVRGNTPSPMDKSSMRKSPTLSDIWSQISCLPCYHKDTGRPSAPEAGAKKPQRSLSDRAAFQKAKSQKPSANSQARLVAKAPRVKPATEEKIGDALDALLMAERSKKSL